MDIWAKKSIFCIVIAIFVNGANDHYTWGYNFPIGTTPQKISVSELGVIFWGSPLFLALLGHSHVKAISTLNFGPFQQNLMETSGPSKKGPRMTTVLVRAEIMEKRPFLRLAESVFWPKMRFIPKKTHKIC